MQIKLLACSSSAGVTNHLKSFNVCIHATDPYIGFFNNLKERCNGPSCGSYEFKESDFMGICRADDADFQFKILLNVDLLLEILVVVTLTRYRKMRKIVSLGFSKNMN